MRRVAVFLIISYLLMNCTVHNNFRYYMRQYAKEKPSIRHMPVYDRTLSYIYNDIKWDKCLREKDTAYVLLQALFYHSSSYSSTVFNITRKLRYYINFGTLRIDTLSEDWNKSLNMKILFGEALNANELHLIKRCNNSDSINKSSMYFTDSCWEIWRLKDTATSVLIKSYRNNRGKVVSKIIK